MVKNIIIKKRFWAGVLLAQFLLFYIFSKIEFIISLHESFFEIQKKTHQLIFSWIPFSAGDVFYILLGILFLFLLIKLYKKENRNPYGITLLKILNCLYFIYQIFWGMLYFQEPLIRKLSKKDPTLEETKHLALKYLDLCRNYRQQVKENKNGVFSLHNFDSLQKEILERQANIPSWITEKKSTAIHSIKPSIFRGIMSDTGILGYYNPFTAEAQYNPELPSTYIPFTMAHETSHQLGFAREQEANFIGFLVGKNSRNIDLKYSTHYYVLKSLLNFLSEQDPEFVKSVLQNYSEGMKRDRLSEKQFVLEHDGFLNSFFGMTNNLFLKSNQQEGSITYSYFIDLLVRYERMETRF